MFRASDVEALDAKVAEDTSDVSHATAGSCSATELLLRQMTTTVESVKHIEDAEFLWNGVIVWQHYHVWCAPPNAGKTTIARLVSERVGAVFEPLSAVSAGVRDVRAVIQRARERAEPTILFVDEVHRFNKTQQDAFLPFVEKGQIALVGATTENPAFSVIPALLSRCRAVQLLPLERDDLDAAVTRALDDADRGLGARRHRRGRR